MIIKFIIKINLFKPRKEKKKNYEPFAPPYHEQNFDNINDKTWFVGGRHMRKTNNNIEFEKVNPRKKN